jgi:spore maturation protein CgeB
MVQRRAGDDWVHPVRVNGLAGRAKVVIYINTVLFKADFDETLYRIVREGSFVITDHKTNAERLFDGNLVTAEHVGDMVEKVRYYLAHQEERERRARNAQIIACERHTFARRAASMIESVGDMA